MLIRGSWECTSRQDLEVMQLFSHHPPGTHATHGEVWSRGRGVLHLLDPIEEDGRFTMKRIVSANRSTTIEHGQFSQPQSHLLEWLLTDGASANERRTFTRAGYVSPEDLARFRKQPYRGR